MIFADNKSGVFHFRLHLINPPTNNSVEMSLVPYHLQVTNFSFEADSLNLDLFDGSKCRIIPSDDEFIIGLHRDWRENASNLNHKYFSERLSCDTSIGDEYNKLLREFLKI